MPCCKRLHNLNQIKILTGGLLNFSTAHWKHMHVKLILMWTRVRKGKNNESKLSIQFLLTWFCWVFPPPAATDLDLAVTIRNFWHTVAGKTWWRKSQMPSLKMTDNEINGSQTCYGRHGVLWFPTANLQRCYCDMSHKSDAFESKCGPKSCMAICMWCKTKNKIL